MSEVEFDTSDVDRWIGVPTGGGQMKEPVTPTDIRRWVQGMQNPNPLYYDEGVAAAGRHGRLVAPQSFCVCTSDSHGAGPAIQGNIPGTHMLFGGDEWWFHGPAIEPGDRIRLERMLYDYKVTETKFAGPTMFSRGDTTYLKEGGEVVAKQRSTSIRYLAEEARKRGTFDDQTEDPPWTVEEIAAVEKQKLEYYQTFLELGHGRRTGVEVGQRLPTRPIGPHTIASFTSEWRAFLMSVWGTFAEDGGKSSLYQSGWLPEMSRDLELAKTDPTQADGLYHGPSRGHVQAEYAQLIGMPRGYGYGASMGAWILDYLTNWVGEHGFVIHSDAKYRSPALTGDVTYLNGEVVDRVDGGSVAVVDVFMTNQRGEAMAKGTAELRLPEA
ncbi:MAG: MaoC family dehydratase N-terminal domain-containing protein [Myxococcota bacterium]|nr:MaoC family dehydratase N-terminal domain-containing protein [Myxococcota bacterium]